MLSRVRILEFLAMGTERTRGEVYCEPSKEHVQIKRSETQILY